MKRKSLLYVEPLGITGGMGHYNDAIVTAYAALGTDVDVITTSTSTLLDTAATVRVSRMFRTAFDRRAAKPIRGVAYALGLLGAVWRARGKDAVIVHFLHRPSIDFWALRSLRAFGVPIILIAHDPQPVLRTQGGRWYRASLRQVSLFVVHGPSARRDLVALLGQPAEIVVAPFGEFRQVTPITPDAARNLLGLGQLEAPVALVVGNLKPGKGVERTVASVGAPGSPVRSLLIAGRVQGTWDVERALTPAPGSPVAIHRVDRVMSDEEELAAYSLADVVLCLYESGYSSGVIARAHAAGRRVVLTDVGDLARQVGPADAIVAVDYSTTEVHAAISSVLARSPGKADSTADRWAVHASTVLAWLNGLTGAPTPPGDDD